jgi:glycosyltransferase involved in cell wall biosynthesis
VVSHEASLTGAPVLAWNLADTLSGTCNVVTLTLKGGPLVAAFRAASVAVYETDRKAIGAAALRRMVREVCDRHGIAQAFVNSVQSRAVLPALRAAGVPTVALVHEFASGLKPPSAMAELVRDADQVVFSTRMTLENAALSCGLGRGAAVQVLPQGKCRVPPGEAGGDPAAERRRLDALLRPGGAAAGEILVIGAGAIEPRKGVDLFIDCAARLCSGPGGGRFRFVWIGAGFDPATDNRGSALLADQIARAGVGAQLAIIPPTSEIEHAYRQADLLLLTSRLDPLPNVAIDALTAGTPVLCFARTTGIAEVLEESGLGEPCVARYLDTADMAAKIAALADDAALRARVAAQGQAVARARFDFPRYAATLKGLAAALQPRAQQVAADTAAIAATGAFRTDFFRPRPRDRDTPESAIGDYVRASWEGAAIRKPMPGFNPSVFADRTPPAAGEPFVRFLAAGRPAGPWAAPVLTPDSPAALPADLPRVALQIHAFHLDEVPGILDRLMRNRARPDLFVSTRPDQVDAARAAFAAYDGTVAAIEPVPNRGRDLAPLLTRFGPRLAAEYGIIGHVHTKKTLDYGSRRTIDAWKVFLFENLLGGPQGGAMLDRILAAMAADPALAIVHPDDPNVMGWGPNRAIAETLAARMGTLLLPDHFDFPVGSMAWMRAGPFGEFVALGLEWSDYPAEPVPHDGTVLHALERLFGAVPAQRGLGRAVTNVPGLSR